MAGERTEQATPHKRQEARKQGDILHSKELTSAAAMLAGVLALDMAAGQAIAAWRNAYVGLLTLGAPSAWEPATIAPTLRTIRRLMLSALWPLGLMMAAVFLGAFVVGMAQTGGVNVLPQNLAFRLDRINPVSNLKNTFSLRGLGRLGKSLIPAALLAVFAVQRIARQLAAPPFSTARIESLGADVQGMLAAAAWLLFGWAAVDFLIEWRSRESRLKMSRQDLLDELKNTEGNPQIRSRIRSLQRQMRQRKVKEEVAKSAVVVTNPTHYAVALAFDFATMDPPRVTAKGRNLLAEEIKAEARWAGVPIVENPPLARSLYRSVEVGRAIPVDLYAAVASILAYLYKQRVERETREQRARAEARRQYEAGRRPPPKPEGGVGGKS